MQFTNQVAPFLLVFSDKFKAVMLYFSNHPFLYYVVIFAIFIAICITIISAPKKQPAITIPPLKKMHTIVSSKDLAAIAGDDVIATQLDLAKAYIEMDQKNLAQRILNETIKLGNPTQKAEAEQLLETL